MKIVLASASKRRSSILTSCGIRHKVAASGAREILNGKSPRHIVMMNAYLKAKKIAEKTRSGYIIGADTVVLLGKKVIGKPRGARHAKDMLKSMSGKAVKVYTGLCVIDVKGKDIIVDYEVSDVKVKKLAPGEITKCFKALGPYDKAGGFSIEGAGSFIFDDIRGSYFNVLGLSPAKLKDMFGELGLDLLNFIKV